MEFLILGPLEARADGRVLALGGVRQRSLLALLLLHRNEAVSTDRLIDGLWGARPPATAPKVVQVYVSRLRALLGAAEPGRRRLLTRRPGYLLELGRDELDLERFEGLVERAGAAMAGDDPAAAAAALRAGLALWRGTPLADLAFEPFSAPAAARLNEQRLAALEGRIEADLALGRAPELIGELAGLVDEHPFRERLRAALVLALYRAGRQAEALEAYRAARTALVEDLGIEPSPELAALERAILRHDPALALPAPPTSAPRPAPASPPGLARALLGPEGERKQVTVLFCDIVGSTALMERLGPEPMHELLGRFHDLAREEVGSYGGWLSSLLGDGFMALMGAPAAHEDHALRAVLAALALRRRLAEGALTAGEPPAPVRVRMGVESGLVVLASMGADPDAAPTAIGETVVVAERLQRLAEPGTILAGEATAALVAGAVRLAPMGPLRLEGMTEPMRAHRVVGMGPGRSPQGGVDARPLGRFVGRQRSLAALAEAVAAARAGRGQVVGVVGEPGMGKSRLVIELRRSLAGQPITLTEGRCLSYGSSTPYLPVQDHIRATCGITEADAIDSVRKKLRFALEEIGLDPDQGEPLLLRLLGAEAQAEALAGLTPEAVKARTIRTLSQMALCGSARRPLVLVYEDLHWVDTLSEEVLSGLAQDLGGAAILLLCTYRPGYQAPWLGLSYARQLSLQPLRPAESADVVRDALGGQELPVPVAQAVIARAEGNPFFAQELARAYRDGGGQGSASAVPGSVADVLAGRIDLLPEAPRRLLRTAAVVGREFSLSLLEPLWDADEPLGPHLAQLKRLEFVYERSDPEGTSYVFTHALTHDVAYEGLLVSKRRALHEAVAQVLERQHAGRLEEVVDRLAHHYSRTERSEAALEYLSRSADKAVQGYAHAEAVRALEEALPHAERLPAQVRERQVIALVVRTVTSLWFLGRFDESLEFLLRHQARVAALGDPRLAGEYDFWLGLISGHTGDSVSAGRFAMRAIDEAERAGDRTTIGKARYVLAWEGFWLGRYAEGIEQGQAAVAALDAAGDWWWLGHALCWEAVNFLSLGAFEDALRAVERARAIGRERQDPRLQSFSAWMRGRIYAVRGDWEAAIADLAESLESSPDPLNSAYAMGWLGFALREKGDHARAITLLEQSLALLTQFRFRRLACVFAGFLAGAKRSAGRIEEARRTAVGALSLSDELRYPWSAALARRELGRIELALGDASEAERNLEEALHVLVDLEMAFEVALTRLDLAELASRLGRTNVAEQHVEACRRSFRALGAPAYLERVEALAARLGGGPARSAATSRSRPQPRPG
jgi:DNA-binding SARP family transcriptional activator/class 3 adenylate cyclase